MARLNFLKGSIRGKVGQFVGSSVHGTDYIKTYTPPSNPRTEGQVAVRTVFKHATAFAKAIYETVLKPYTFPHPKKVTAHNRMIQVNEAMFREGEWNIAKLKIFEGPLGNPGIKTAVISDASLKVTVTRETAVGEGSDLAFVILHDETADKTLTAQGTRQDGTLEIDTAAFNQADLSGVHAYLVFAQPLAYGSGGTGQVSGTAYLAASAV
jgi:hypothetical protein